MSQWNLRKTFVVSGWYGLRGEAKEKEVCLRTPSDFCSSIITSPGDGRDAIRLRLRKDRYTRLPPNATTTACIIVGLQGTNSKLKGGRISEEAFMFGEIASDMF